MNLPIIAIIGRPNVGKSTLFNRLCGKRVAIISDIPGTTRDRVSIDTEWDGRPVMIVDTGGLDPVPSEGFWENIRAQTLQAVHDADAIILMTDANEGITFADEEASDIARRSGKPTVVAVNKADTFKDEAGVPEFYRLGFDTVCAVSAYMNMGVADLMASVMSLVGEEGEQWDDDSTRVAILGRPNVGKSSVFNMIVGGNRAIVSPIPGTTRDAIDSHFIWEEQRITFIDTAGIRRRGKIEPGVEKYSSLRALTAARRAEVCLLVIDAEDGVTAQDKHVAGYIKDSSRACVIVVNKSDLLPKREDALESVRAETGEALSFLTGSPILFVSALTGRSVERIIPQTLAVHKEFTKEVADGEVSRCIFDAVGKMQPKAKGRKKPKILKARQQRTAPPTFLLTVSLPEDLHFSYRRYLENKLRERFGFSGTPIRIIFRKGT